MKEEKQSPLPPEIRVQNNDEVKIELFDFSTAMKKVAEGKKISKKEWKDIKIYGEMKEVKLIIHKEDGKDYAWILSAGDLAGKDFIII